MKSRELQWVSNSLSVFTRVFLFLSILSLFAVCGGGGGGSDAGSSATPDTNNEGGSGGGDKPNLLRLGSSSELLVAQFE
jgi:hypothetical protein